MKIKAEKLITRENQIKAVDKIVLKNIFGG